MTSHDEVCTPAEARAVLEALGVLDRDGSVVVRGTPVGLGQYTRGLCPTPILRHPLGLVPWVGELWAARCGEGLYVGWLRGRLGLAWCDVRASYVRGPTGGRCPEDGSFGWTCRTWGGLSTLVEDRCT